MGAYIRVSTEEQASNPEGSIKSQEQRIRAAIESRNFDGSFGELAGVYVDRGLSGKDTNRPELRRLLKDIESGAVSAVMVTELSRLSRSIRDFSDMWELMRTHGCEFLSLREQFDTTTASGEMVLFMLANIAQFERKQTSERISANFNARAERGLFNGGCVPFGYELDPEKNGHLRIVESEAEVVRQAYRVFLEEGSLAAAGKKLNELGLNTSRRRKVEKVGGGKARVNFFTVGNLQRTLTNPVYLGIRTFKVRGEVKTTRGKWDPIISQKDFNRAQVLLKGNYKKRLKVKAFNRFHFLLSNRVVCSTCEQRMAGKSAHGNGGKISYYEHSWAARRDGYLKTGHAKCEPYRVPTKVIEPLVWSDVIQVLTDPGLARSLILEAQQAFSEEDVEKQARRAQDKAAECERQIESIVEHVGHLPKNLSPAKFFTRMEKLEEEKRAWADEAMRLRQSKVGNEPPASLESYQSFVDGLRALLRASEQNPDLRCKIVQRLVESVRVEAEAIEIRYHVGESRLIPLKPDAEDKKQSQTQNGGLALTTPSPVLLKPYGSTRLTNGGGGGS